MLKLHGRERTLRRLGTSDIKKIQKIFHDAILGADIRGIPLEFDSMTASDFIRFAAVAMNFTQDDTFEWIKSLIVPALTDDEDLFLDDYPLVAVEMYENESFKCFLGNIGKLLKKVAPAKVPQEEPLSQND